MRITPNHPRLRLIALACWAVSIACIWYSTHLVLDDEQHLVLIICILLFAMLVLAVGTSFWLLGNDRHAGIIFDAKGLLMNLGHSSAFVGWENIERIGVAAHRNTLLHLGSRKQIGLALRNVDVYIQTYEQRLPYGRGALNRALHGLGKLLLPFAQPVDRALVAELAHNRAKTGYDVLIPEAMLGGKADAFARLVGNYLEQPTERNTLDGLSWAR